MREPYVVKRATRVGFMLFCNNLSFEASDGESFIELVDEVLFTEILEHDISNNSVVVAIWIITK